MALIPPIYPPEDLAKLNEEQRNELRIAVLRVLQTDSQVRQLLKDKTSEAYEKLKKSGH
jgi:hypothetical protein